MSCNKINTCFRYGTDYQDRLISFQNGIAGLSNFRYEITQRETVINLTVGNGLDIIGDKVCIQGDALESLLPDAYDTVFWLDINGQTRDLFSEQLEISADKCDCANVYNLAFTIIPVDIEETVTEIRLNFDDLTPEQQLALTGPKGDKPAHEWNGTSLSFENPDGSMGESVNLKGQKGDKGETGDPFTIYKSYPTIVAMESDFANVPDGLFVAISSNEEDPDNAKLFLRGTDEFTFITDLSGAQGIKGDKGDRGEAGPAGSVPIVQKTGSSTTDAMSQKAVTDEVSRIDDFIYQFEKRPANRALTGYSIFIDNSYWFDGEDWFNGIDRVLHTVTVGSANNGVVGVALFTISGTTATLFSSKNLNVVAGTNVFTATEISDTPPVAGTRYYVAFKKVSGDTIGVKADNTGGGRNIPNANPTQVNTNNFSTSYYLSLKKEVLTNNQNFNFANEVAKKDNIFIPAGTHSVAQKVSLRSGQKIYGIPGKSILEFDTTTLTDCLEIKDIDSVLLDGLIVKGKDANTTMIGNDVGSGVIATVADAVALTGLGTHNGIVINNAKNLNFRNLEVSNFNGYGIKGENYGALYNKTSKFTDVMVHDCYAGVAVRNQFEYNTLTGIHSYRNQIGVIVDAGNNSFTGCNISGNRVNWLFLSGLNNAHGSITGGSHNHASLAGFIFKDIQYGQAISGANIWYSLVYIINSRGITFSGSIFSNSSFTVDGVFTGGGVNQVSGSCFVNGSFNYSNGASAANLRLKNNYVMGGGSDTGYNN